MSIIEVKLVSKGCEIIIFVINWAFTRSTVHFHAAGESEQLVEHIFHAKTEFSSIVGFHARAEFISAFSVDTELEFSLTVFVV